MCVSTGRSPWFSVKGATGLVLVAVWLGLVAGLVEAFYLVVVQQSLQGELIHKSIDLIWMAPIAEATVFAALALGLALLARWLPRIVVPPVVAAVLGFVWFLAIVSVVQQVHTYAQWLLAAGLASQASRFTARRPERVFAVARRTVVGLTLIVAALVTGVQVWRVASETQLLSRLPPARSGAPNVLLITLDTVRASSLSLYGYPRRTSPQLERLAAGGVVFEQALSAAPWTLPSHASIFTGRLPHELSYGWTKPLQPQYPTLAEELGRRGYESVGFVANVLYASSGEGLSVGFVRYDDYAVSLGQAVLSGTLSQAITNSTWIRRAANYHEPLNRRRAPAVNEDVLSWLSARDKARPFFAFVNYFDAKEPLFPPTPFDSLFGPTQPGGDYVYNGQDISPSGKEAWSPDSIDKNRNAYDSSIAYLDDQVGRLLDELAKRGILDNTLVVITSDHGELLGEHQLFSHGNSLYIQALHVPLVILFPGHVPAGMTVRAPVSLRDLGATVLEVIGATNPSTFPGTSMARFWNSLHSNDVSTSPVAVFSELSGAQFLSPQYPAAQGDMVSVLMSGQHYIRNGDGREELYNWPGDAEEAQDLARTKEGLLRLERFRAALSAVGAARQ